MADEIINIVDVASKGVVIDTPPIALGPNLFTDAKKCKI